MPIVTQGDLPNWVSDHVDDLVTEFAPEDSVVVLVAEEGGVDGDDEDDGADDSAFG